MGPVATPSGKGLLIGVGVDDLETDEASANSGTGVMAIMGELRMAIPDTRGTGVIAGGMLSAFGTAAGAGEARMVGACTALGAVPGTDILADGLRGISSGAAGEAVLAAAPPNRGRGGAETPDEGLGGTGGAFCGVLMKCSAAERC